MAAHLRAVRGLVQLEASSALLYLKQRRRLTTYSSACTANCCTVPCTHGGTQLDAQKWGNVAPQTFRTTLYRGPLVAQNCNRAGRATRCASSREPVDCSPFDSEQSNAIAIACTARATSALDITLRARHNVVEQCLAAFRKRRQLPRSVSRNYIHSSRDSASCVPPAKSTASAHIFHLWSACG